MAEYHGELSEDDLTESSLLKDFETDALIAAKILDADEKIIASARSGARHNIRRAWLECHSRCIISYLLGNLACRESHAFTNVRRQSTRHTKADRRQS
ncbi:hypothetical protein FHL15_002017 [Xylaria flabelliformis]|uniref:Uncharacterized protein n=1 Tax=Xylaria flabelliformis TaxID=2512241 RepID=A0A553IAJ1_9PEZI|nr:hypothetical protein FHL15_002017 [Xylaria flabelliformis]